MSSPMPLPPPQRPPARRTRSRASRAGQSPANGTGRAGTRHRPAWPGARPWRVPSSSAPANHSPDSHTHLSMYGLGNSVEGINLPGMPVRLQAIYSELAVRFPYQYPQRPIGPPGTAGAFRPRRHDLFVLLDFREETSGGTHISPTL